MNRMLSGAARAAALLASVAAAVVLAAAPGAAASVPPMNESYALQATGPVSVQQAGDATYDGSPVVLPNVDAAGLLSTGVVTDRAGAASASSRLPGVVLALPGQATLRARAVSSSCRSGGKSPAVTGTARVTGGVIRAGRRIIRLPATAAPNTRLVIPGVRGDHDQPAVHRGGRDADRGRAAGSGRCAVTRSCSWPPRSARPPAWLPPRWPAARVIRLTRGGLGLLLLGGLAYTLSRRRRLAAA